MYKKYHFNSNSASCGPCQQPAPQTINTSNQCNGCNNQINKCNCNQLANLLPPPVAPTCVEGLILTTNENCQMVPLAPVEGRPLTGVIKNGKSIWGVGDAINSYKLEQSISNPNQLKLISGGNTVSTVNILASTAPIQSISVNGTPVAPIAGNVNLTSIGSSPVQSISLNGTPVTPSNTGNVNLLVSASTNGINSITPGFGITANTVAGATTIGVKPADWVYTNPTTAIVDNRQYIPRKIGNTTVDNGILATDGKAYPVPFTMPEIMWYLGRLASFKSIPLVISNYSYNAASFTPGTYSTAHNVPLTNLTMDYQGGSSLPTDGSLTSVAGFSPQFVVYQETGIGMNNEPVGYNEAYSKGYGAVNYISGAAKYIENIMFSGVLKLAHRGQSSTPFLKGFIPYFVRFSASNDSNFSTIHYSEEVSGQIDGYANNESQFTASNGQGSFKVALPFHLNIPALNTANLNAIAAATSAGLPTVRCYLRAEVYVGDTATYGGGQVSIMSPNLNTAFQLVPRNFNYGTF
jgi:hypothetical protein